MHSIEVSVIVPCYNHAHYLDKCLQSVLDQTYPDWECIIVNDGSPDNTEEVAQTWLNRDARFKYLKKVNGGLASARNAGLSLSSGKYIQFLDSDDTIPVDKLEKHVNFLGSNPGTDIVYSDYFFIDSEGKILHEHAERYRGLSFEQAENVLQRLIRANFLLIHCVLIRTKIIKDGLMFDEATRKIIEDWDFWLRVAARGYKFKFCPGAVVCYLKHNNSLTASDQNIQEGILGLVRKIESDRTILGVENSRQFSAIHNLNLACNYYNNKKWKMAQRFLVVALRADWKDGGGIATVKLYLKAIIHRITRI